MDKLLLNINDSDMYLINNKFFKQSDLNKKEEIRIKSDFNLYKKEIKEEINRLYKYYSDLSNNNSIDNDLCNNDLCNNNLSKDEETYIYHFNLFLKKLINNIKLKDKNNYIQSELINYSNKYTDSSNLLTSDVSNNFIDLLDKRTFFLNKNNKVNNIQNFLDVKKCNNRILPKKIDKDKEK